MLNEQQLHDIKELQEICKKEGGILLKLNWEMLKARKNVEMDFFHYENEALIGFLAIYQFGAKYEICGMVHPSNRKQGIFTRLFNNALVVIPQDAKKILINAPAKSESAKHWIQSKTCDYSFSEYQMKWESTKLESPEKLVQLRKATSADLETKIQLDVACFDFGEAEARAYNENNVDNDKRISYIMEANHEPVGKICVQLHEMESYICGFAIFPKFQGKGYGRNALTQMVLAESGLGKDIFLEVAAENKYALKLYEECGFQPYEVQDYYQLR